MSKPSSVRYDPEVRERLDQFLQRNPGMSLGAATNLLVDEALRMREHPRIVFRDGPLGRRAGLVAGPDVWEVIAAVRSARTAETGIDEERIVDVVCDTSGLTPQQVRAAIAYWSDHQDEIDQLITVAKIETLRAKERWRHERDLLAG